MDSDHSNHVAFDDTVDSSQGNSAPAPAHEKMNAVEALKYIDDRWYKTVAGKKSRWMDLIGDYAGNERFILDGESLLQHVLEDPLLALARADDPSFQILHAVHSMERLLDEMLRRSAIFDIVFWEDTRHLTLKGGTDYSVSSRSLARALLFGHLVEHSSEMGLEIFSFSSLKDPAWLAYQQRTKPMFVMLNDGGTRKDTNYDMAIRILIQRIFVFDLLTSGVAVTLLHGAEFRDSKIFSFVLEERFGSETRQSFPAALWDAAQDGETELENKSTGQTSLVPLAPLHVTPPGQNKLDLLLKKVLDYLVMHQIELPDLFWELTSLFSLHIIILPTLPVSERAHPVEELHEDLVAMLVGTFLPKIHAVITSFIQESNCFIDIDGRVFCRILHHTITAPRQTNALTELVGPDISSRLESVWRSASAPPPDFRKLLTYFPHHGDPGPSSTTSDGPKPFTLLPFHNHIFDEELAIVHVKVSDEDQASSSPSLEFCSGTPFTDTNHWHDNHRAILPKHLGGEGWRDANERARQWRLRRGQRFMVHMQRLSSSLTGASGKVIKQISITSTGRKVSEIIDDSSIRKPRPDEKVSVNQQKKGRPVMPARERIRQKNTQEKKAKEDSSSQIWWQEQLRQLQMIPTCESKMSHLRSLLRNPKAASGWLSIEVRLYHLHLTTQQWVDEHDPEDTVIHDHYTVSIMRTVKKLYTSDFLTETTLRILASIMISLGFGNYIPPLEDDASHNLQPDRDLAFDFIKLLKSRSHKPIHKFMAIKEDPVVWQLRVFGEYMDRSMDSAPDSRVSFEPDAWQREVLDGLDEPKTSLLVVAPTSAGKTFISFYAMEKVLRESDDGILVYVAPSKALVNQVAAEVHARFRKEVDGQICWSIQTRDYRVHDFQKCQILVTVPEMLAIMLLSPPLARTWNPRIRRIILDEIHTIGQDESGTVWEQMILMAPCPIIGLSATIGMPEKFNAWLETVQKAKGFDHKFIHHPHRYSHLRKFAYFPQLLDKDKPFLGLDGSRSSTEMMRFIHPVSTLSFAGTMPPDLSLESSDLLRLYRVLSSQNVAGVEQLDPNVVFSRDTFIRQKDVLRYEAEIKNDVLAQLIAAPDALDSSSLLQKVVQEVQDPVLKETPKSQLNAPPSSSVFLSGLIHLLTDMRASDALPALLFNFDRHECVGMASHILETLEKAEEVWRAESPEWKRKIDKWEAWKACQKNKERLAQKAAARKRAPDDEMLQDGEHQSWESYFDPEDPSPQFSFADTSAYAKEELLEDIRLLSWTSTASTLDFLFRALRRGIAVHHSGMNKTYRVLVERLFRVGFLRVVIATGTLALGINAPTKSSVFCGDSPFLTALTFRQCAGRAGRRGFDLLGRVIFYGIPLDRINRILLSKLPRLTGTFPLSSTMVLRLFGLLEGSNYAPHAVHAIRSILRLPHISFGSEVGKGQLLHHLRFSIDYLRRAHLLSQDGKPANLFGVASHLYFTEPSNFAMAVLLQHGVIHEICSQASSVDAERDLVILLCHLFGRRYLPEVYATTSNIRDLVQKGPSCVVLAPLHPKARAVLLAHQKQILDIFSAYALAFSTQHRDELGPDNQLPLSGAVGPSDTSTLPQTPLFAHLSETARKPYARSLFVATSGHDDTFGDVGELARTVRHGVYLNKHAIPTVEHILDPKLPLNAYLYDFFVHGQVDALVNMNGLRHGDLWFVIQAFHLILLTIRGDLENLLLNMSIDSDRDAAALHETESNGHMANLSDDSGYCSSDPSERGGEGAVEAQEGIFARPRGVQDRDWKVYEVFNSIANQFTAKFKTMWA